MTSPQARPQLVERRQWARASLLVDDDTSLALMPLGSFEKIDEVNAEGLVCLSQLPVLDPALAFQFLAKASDLIRQGFVRGRA